MNLKSLVVVALRLSALNFLVRLLFHTGPSIVSLAQFSPKTSWEFTSVVLVAFVVLVLSIAVPVLIWVYSEKIVVWIGDDHKSSEMGRLFGQIP